MCFPTVVLVSYPEYSSGLQCLFQCYYLFGLTYLLQKDVFVAKCINTASRPSKFLSVFFLPVTPEEILLTSVGEECPVNSGCKHWSASTSSGHVWGFKIWTTSSVAKKEFCHGHAWLQKEICPVTWWNVHLISPVVTNSGNSLLKHPLNLHWGYASTGVQLFWSTGGLVY